MILPPMVDIKTYYARYLARVFRGFERAPLLGERGRGLGPGRGQEKKLPQVEATKQPPPCPAEPTGSNHRTDGAKRIG